MNPLDPTLALLTSLLVLSLLLKRRIYPEAGIFAFHPHTLALDGTNPSSHRSNMAYSIRAHALAKRMVRTSSHTPTLHICIPPSDSCLYTVNSRIPTNQ